MVIRRTNPFLFEKVLTPSVTLDLGAASLYTYIVFKPFVTHIVKSDVSAIYGGTHRKTS